MKTSAFSNKLLFLALFKKETFCNKDYSFYIRTKNMNETNVISQHWTVQLCFWINGDSWYTQLMQLSKERPGLPNNSRITKGIMNTSEHVCHQPNHVWLMLYTCLLPHYNINVFSLGQRLSDTVSAIFSTIEDLFLHREKNYISLATLIRAGRQYKARFSVLHNTVSTLFYKIQKDQYHVIILHDKYGIKHNRVCWQKWLMMEWCALVESNSCPVPVLPESETLHPILWRRQR